MYNQKLKTAKNICNRYLDLFSAVKIGSKFILSVSKFARQRLNTFKVLSLVSLFVKLIQWSFLTNSFLVLEE